MRAIFGAEVFFQGYKISSFPGLNDGIAVWVLQKLASIFTFDLEPTFRRNRESTAIGTHSDGRLSGRRATPRDRSTPAGVWTIGGYSAILLLRSGTIHSRRGAKVSVQLPRDDRMQHMRHTIIPYYVQGVFAGSSALALSDKFDPLARIEIVVEGERDPVHRTVLTVYVQTVSSMAAIYSRLLLEFLGLRSGGMPSILQPVGKRRNGDIGIEHYQRQDGTPLAMVLPSIIHEFPDAQEVGRAWITVCDFAGQRLAHATDDLKLGNIGVTPMLRRAFETIPQVVDHAFHNALD